MNTLNTESGDRPLRTSDLAAAASRSTAHEETGQDQDERLAPLFSTDLAEDYRARWTAVQGSFVDDPREAVQQGDELVAQVMKSLAESFAAEREELEGQLGEGGEASTETLRVALRRYRSFFERLLAL
jgi:inorganic triphosphatase YgiF